MYANRPYMECLGLLKRSIAKHISAVYASEKGPLNFLEQGHAVPI